MFEDWPRAINEKLICSEVEKNQGILNRFIQEDISHLKYLDFEGQSSHYAKALIARSSQDADYLIYAPYDVIVCFDVIDHIDNPLQVLQSLNKLLSKSGRLYLRVHPYLSRHASHIYKEVNKAYAHLILTDEELSSFTSKNIQVCLRPVRTYETMIREASFKIQSCTFIKEPLEPFFYREDVMDKIIARLGEFPEKQMEIQFIDYVLTK